MKKPFFRILKGKFNPHGKELFSSKMRSEVTYKAKQSFLDETGSLVMADILNNGGLAEVQKRGVLENGAEYIVLKVYFLNDEN